MCLLGMLSGKFSPLTLLHSEQLKLWSSEWSFGYSECSRVKSSTLSKGDKYFVIRVISYRGVSIPLKNKQQL